MLLLPLLLIATSLASASAKNVVNFKISSNKQTTTEVKFSKRDTSIEGTLIGELTNQQSFYSFPLQFGSEREEIIVLVDTGSSDLWVSGSDNAFCRTSGNSRDVLTNIDDLKKSSPYGGKTNNFENLLKIDPILLNPHQSTPTKSLKKRADSPVGTVRPTATMDCSEYGTFDSSRSSSFRSNNTEFYLSYADQTFAYGTWVQDTIVLHDTEIKDMNFGLANLSDSNMGVLGIGLEGLESTNVGMLIESLEEGYTYSNFPTKLVEDGIINRRVYSLFLNEASADTGNLLFGGVDHAKYDGNLEVFPLINMNYGVLDKPIRFELTLTNLTASDGTYQNAYLSTPYYANLDSGTTFTYFPTALLDALAYDLGLTYSYQQGVYYTACPSSSTAERYRVKFNLQGFEVDLPISTFLLKDSGSNNCIFTILEGNEGITLGDNFLRNLYVVYDLDNFEIALANVKFTDDEDIEVVQKDGGIPGASTGADYDKTFDVEGLYSSIYGSSFSTGSSRTATSGSTRASGSSSSASRSSGSGSGNASATATRSSGSTSASGTSRFSSGFASGSATGTRSTTSRVSSSIFYGPPSGTTFETVDEDPQFTPVGSSVGSSAGSSVGSSSPSSDMAVKVAGGFTMTGLSALLLLLI